MALNGANRRRRTRYAGHNHRIREEERRAVRSMGPTAPRVEGTGPLCPTDADHGRLSSWTGGTLYDLYCSADEHTTFRFFDSRRIGEAAS